MDCYITMWLKGFGNLKFAQKKKKDNVVNLVFLGMQNNVIFVTSSFKTIAVKKYLLDHTD